MLVSLQRAALPEHRRVLMTSDIHGHADGLRAILKKAGFCKDDILVIVGDLLEKGPDSIGTVRLVMELCRDYTVYPVMGNVDLWRWEFLSSDDPAMWREMKAYSFSAARWWGNSLLHELCAELGEPLTPDTDICAIFPRIQKHFAREMDFISHLPTILDTQRYTFVHGGIPHERLDELVGTDAFPILKFDDFYGKGLRFQKYVVAGHWPTVLYSKTYPRYDPIIDRDRHIVLLDGACGVKNEGQLNMLSLPDCQSGDFTLYTWDHLPTITALDHQDPSPESECIYIPWNDHAVELVREAGEISHILYHGRPMVVPTQFIFDHNGVLSCSDTTNYVLPVDPGDQMHLILRLNYGCCVKKNGVSGWYFGRYQMNEVKEQ